jgi:hypothetical protein
MPVSAIAPVPVSTIVTKAGNLLLDDSHVRWGVDELIRWTNEAMGAILALRPSAFAKTDVHTLVAGTYQSLPNGSAMLIDVIRNIGADGVAPGRAIRLTSQKAMDDANPNWHTGTPSAEIRHFTHNPAVPKVYYVYPPAIAGTKVEVQHAVLPPDVATQADSIPIGAEYVGPIVNYVCYRCNLKDSEFSNAQVGQLFYQAFMASMGMNPGQAAQ